MIPVWKIENDEETQDDNKFKCKTCYSDKFYKTFLLPVIYTPEVVLTHISILDPRGLFLPNI